MKNVNWLLIILMFVISPVIAQPQTVAPDKVDSLGRKQGFWRKYVKDTLKYEGTFKDDYPTGEFKYYYFDKNIKSVVQYSEKGLKAVTINYHENGKKMAEGEYWAKKKHGSWKYYSTDGNLIATEDYHMGIPEGEWITCYDNGKPNQILHYTAGAKNGAWIQFYPDSLIKVRGNYVNDKKNGLIYYYNLNGVIMVSGNYKDDIEDGIWMYFDDLGRADRRLTYSGGNIIKEEINIRGIDKQNNYIDIEKIAYVFNNNGSVTIRMNDATDYITVRKMDDFRYTLNENKFFRVNTNYIVSLWSITNKKAYTDSQRILILKPETSAPVIVADDAAAGFLHWADLIKGEVDPKNPPRE
jgi:antitoxin component YwqK of YwqJK toxin-antitoxin module